MPFAGSDLDIESMQHIKDSVFIGDEFGPYLVEFDAATGKVCFLPSQAFLVLHLALPCSLLACGCSEIRWL